MPQRIEVPGMGIVEFPDGMSDDQISAAIRANMQGGGQGKTPVQRIMQNLAAGALRGAGSIGATLLTPFDMLAGNTRSIGNPERRQAMDAALQTMGADTDSFAFGGGKLAGEIAGTAGVGGVLAGGARMLPGAQRVAPLLDAVRTSGFSAGGVGGAGGMALRTAGGGATGLAAAGAVNPDDAVTGGVVGAALPGALKAAGMAGSAAAKPFRSPELKAADAVLQALEQDPATVAAKLRNARAMVPGSQPTIAQVLRTPQASTLERIVSDSPGGASLKELYASQNAARLSALDAVAPVDPRGFRSAQQDFGTGALESIRAGDKAARARTGEAYRAVPGDEAALYLPDLAGVRDELFPRGAFGSRDAVEKAVKTAQEIGTIELPAVKAARAAAGQQSLAQAVRRAGGISITNNSGLRGEVAGLKGDLKNLVRVNGGKSPAEMAEAMFEAGFLKDESTDSLFEALRNNAMGGEVSSIYDDGSRAWSAAMDSAMGPPPGAERVPAKVTLNEFDALRKSIGNEQRAAARDPARATEALALSKMRDRMDDRINEVVRGDGRPDEVLPIAWADALTDAQKLKRQQVDTFRTGPQSLAFKTGADNLPSVQGGEFAAKVWGNRPGIADDLKQFKKAISGNPELMKQFRSMVATEGAGTATNAGNLTGKFVRWVENTLPGLKEVFEPAQVKAMQRIAADIKRAEVAAAAGMARGSPTYQNASNALSLGLLDSPLLGVAANRIPLINQVAGPMLNTLRDSGRKTKAEGLAQLLADPQMAAEAMGGLLSPQAPRFVGLQRGLLTSAPVALSD